MNKRNPCKVLVESLDSLGHVVLEWRRGYAQERRTFDGEAMVFVMEGGDTGIGRWYRIEEVEMTKGKWSNKTNKPVSKKSHWRRSK